MADQLDCALDLMRRLPPQKVEENLTNLIDLCPHLTEDLLSAIDQPLKIQRCKQTGRDYLLCDYNRDSDSYSYFEGGVSSVYMWDLDDGFAAVVLIKKVNDETAKVQGGWDSIHVMEVQTKGRSAHYKLTSTIMLNMLTSGQKLGNMNLSGSLTRQTEQDFPVEDYNAHVANMGRMVEDMEIKMRNSISQIYFGKTKDIVNDLRSSQPLSELEKQAAIQSELVGKLHERQR
ncbi:hypothetical protein HK102_003204 [Quaeritorhiza haematococci]|nr:hypothetical protein HK102_003204 [Quaeritorhiza haematococci]